MYIYAISLKEGKNKPQNPELGVQNNPSRHADS